MQKHPIHACRPVLTSVAVAALLVLGSGAASAQTRTSGRTASRSELPTPAVQREVRNWLFMARKFHVRASTERLPWQFYKYYVGRYDQLRVDVASRVVTDAAARRRQDQTIRFFGELRDMIAEMGKEQKVIDGITNANTSIPHDKREAILEKATERRAALLAEFRKKIDNPPGSKPVAQRGLDLR